MPTTVAVADQSHVGGIGQLEDVVRAAQDGDGGRRLFEHVCQLPPLQVFDGANRGAQQLHVNARVELPCRERLDQVIVGAGLQSLEACFFAGAGGQHQHRQVTERLVGA